LHLEKHQNQYGFSEAGMMIYDVARDVEEKELKHIDVFYRVE